MPVRRIAALLVVLVAAVVGTWIVTTRDGTTQPSVTVPRPTDEDTRLVAPSGPEVVLAAGDIATCDGADAETAALIEGQSGVIAALGDLAYEDGSAARFRDCYDPTWGAFRDRTRPTIGNHDAQTAGAAGYFDYFGDFAGPDPQGYYSYDLGAWHVVVLNSNCDLAGGCDPDSPQVAWLQDDLAAADNPNVLAYWHEPRFSTGDHGDQVQMDTFWRVLADAGADVVLSGHDHDYQRFVPLDRDGVATPDGLTQFVVGTGGIGLRAFGDDRDTIAYRQNEQHGVLRLELQDCGYTYAFLAVDTDEPLDRGAVTDTCGPIGTSS